jgi:transposase
MMGKPNFSEAFKRDAVAQITERGYPVAEVSQRLGVSAHSLYALKRQLTKVVSGDAGNDAEIYQLKRELARVTEERDILKRMARPVRKGFVKTACWSASTYPVSRLMPWPRWISAQSGPHKSAGAEHHI